MGGFNALRRTAAVFIILVSFACASQNQRVIDALAPAADLVETVECDGEKCDLYWERAKLWVIRHSHFKIRLANNMMIQTYKAPADKLSYAFAVVKEPVSGSTYKIEFGSYCGNPEGCDIDPVSLKSAFNFFVVNGQDLLIGAGYLNSIN